MNIQHTLTGRAGTWAVIFVFLAAPILANAGIFSIVSLWGLKDETNQQKTKQLTHNSQTLPVLKAATNNDPNPAKGGGDITVIDDTALLASQTVTGDAVSLYRPKSDQISVYEVREGDTLSQIAEMFHVSANTIRWANDFDGSIQPGQQLVILPVTGVKHTIKYGGTVEDLAELYNAEPREIALFNGISVDTELEPGMEIVVPNGEMYVEKETKSSGSSSSGSTRVASRSSGGASTSGYFIHPIPGGVKTQGVHGYNAVDFGAPVGTSVRAAASGQVIISRQGGWNGGYGTYVVIKHDNGTQTLYAHHSSNTVAAGQWVSQGDVIGYSGNTGRSTGPHLHFEVRGGSNPF